MNMCDFNNTVIVSGLGSDVAKEDFINHFKRIGNILKSDIAIGRCEGIVTFEDSETAKKAVEELNEENLKGKKIKVELSNTFYGHELNTKENQNCNEDGEITTAWSKWCTKDGGCNGGGGKGCKGGVGSPDVPSGHDGDDGEPGPGGKGGAGGKPAVTKNLGKRSHSGVMHNENGITGGGKGGKGGLGGRNVPSGHDGEDGEPGPGGKGGAGGRPAIGNFQQYKNSYDWNGFVQTEPWYTRWFGIGRAKKKNEFQYTSHGGGKGGKGGLGANNVPSGHDGEDGEAGPGGRGGAGGRPAV